ncbi:MAG: hypothetical protein KDC56_05335 [Flavobacteriaceae bacterium]|nr:hypothetical protein [Flavobacteriaceae bacterium]
MNCKAMNISGKWNGAITYGKEYGKFAGNEVLFEMEIVQNNDHFHGVSKDTGGFGVNPDPASIEGKITGDTISFIKVYPTFHYINSMGEQKINPSRKGSEIRYTGKYDKAKEVISGNWEMSVWVLVIAIIPWRIKATGTWEMQLVNT